MVNFFVILLLIVISVELDNVVILLKEIKNKMDKG